MKELNEMENSPENRSMNIAGVSTPTPRKIVALRGHCAFCLVSIRWKNVQSTLNANDFQCIWPYLQHKFKGTLNIQAQFQFLSFKDGVTDIPPVCTSCDFELEKLLEMHRKLELIQKRMERFKRQVEMVADGIKRKMKNSTFPSNGRIQGVNSLRVKNVICEVATGQGANKYLGSTVEYLKLMGQYNSNLIIPSQYMNPSSSPTLIPAPSERACPAPAVATQNPGNGNATAELLITKKLQRGSNDSPTRILQKYQRRKVWENESEGHFPRTDDMKQGAAGCTMELLGEEEPKCNNGKRLQTDNVVVPVAKKPKMETASHIKTASGDGEGPNHDNLKVLKKADAKTEPERRYRCVSCGKQFKHLKSVKHHFKDSDGTIYGCDNCGTKFTRSVNLMKHQIKRIDHNSGQGRMVLACRNCGRDFSTYGPCTDNVESNDNHADEVQIKSGNQTVAGVISTSLTAKKEIVDKQ